MKNQIKKIQKRLAIERGKISENKVVDALNSNNKPDWIYLAKLSDAKLDKAGIDVVVSTDVGNLFLQIKNSFYGKQKFLKNKKDYHNQYIAVIVIHSYFPEQQILDIAIQELQELRNYFLLKRNVELI